MKLTMVQDIHKAKLNWFPEEQTVQLLLKQRNKVEFKNGYQSNLSDED